MSLYPSLVEASAPLESEQEQQTNALVEPSAPSEHDLIELHAITQTLQEHGQRLQGMDSASRHHVSNLASSREGTQHLLSELQHRVESDAFLVTVEQSRASIPSTATATTTSSGGEDEQKEDSDWWTMVPEQGPTIVEESELDGAYVFIETSDVVDSMAEFIAMSLARIPETRSLSSTRLQRLLALTFGELREKGTIGRIWDWGQFLYTTYGWTTCAIGIYREPAMAYLVLRTIWSVTKWVVGTRIG